MCMCMWMYVYMWVYVCWAYKYKLFFFNISSATLFARCCCAISVRDGGSGIAYIYIYIYIYIHAIYIYVCVYIYHVSLLVFYILATSMVISERVPTCDIAHSRRLYSGDLLEIRALTVIWSLTQSHYPDTALTSPFPTPACHAEHQTMKWQVSIFV